MKRVFHFVKSNYLTGVENVVINICTMVKGYDYTFVSTKGPINKYLNYYGIKHIIVPKMTPINIFKIIRKYKPNIVQAHDERMSVFMAFSGPFCKVHGIKMVSELHNDDPKSTKFWRLRSILYAISSLFYNNIILVSNSIQKHYAYRKIISNKTSIIPNIVNPYRITQSLIKRPVKKWDCAFLGRMMYQKNPIRFLKIIYKLKEFGFTNIKAIMMGNGELLNNVKVFAKKYNLENNVYFTGFVLNPYKYLQESKLLIMTSRFEGLPLVALESLMIGTPVVSTHLRVLEKILGNSGNFEITDDDFVKQINKLINNKLFYNNVKINELRKVHKFNNVQRFINSYKSLYN